MGIRFMWDAAYPGSVSPANVASCTVVAGYIGGDTPHIWTGAEWAATTHAQPYRLPIFVRSDPGNADPVMDVMTAVSWLHANAVPTGATIALDLETAVNPAYIRSFDAELKRDGYQTMIYGSSSTIFQNPMPSGGIWAARWNGDPTIPAGAVAVQYEEATSYDLSAIDTGVPLWYVGPREVPEMAEAAGEIVGAGTESAGVWKPGSVTKFAAICDTSGRNNSQDALCRVAFYFDDASFGVQVISLTDKAKYAVHDVSEWFGSNTAQDAHCVAVSITRQDTGPGKVGWAVYA